MKISYQAFLQQHTIQEHFLLSLIKTYHELRVNKELRNPYPPVTKEMLVSIKTSCLKSIGIAKQKAEKDSILDNASNESPNRTQKQIDEDLLFADILEKARQQDCVDDLFNPELAEHHHAHT